MTRLVYHDTEILHKKIDFNSMTVTLDDHSSCNHNDLGGRDRLTCNEDPVKDATQPCQRFVPFLPCYPQPLASLLDCKHTIVQGTPTFN